MELPEGLTKLIIKSVHESSSFLFANNLLVVIDLIELRKKHGDIGGVYSISAHHSRTDNGTFPNGITTRFIKDHFTCYNELGNPQSSKRLGDCNILAIFGDRDIFLERHNVDHVYVELETDDQMWSYQTTLFNIKTFTRNYKISQI